MSKVLRNLKADGHWLVRETGRDILLTKEFSGKAIVVNLEKDDGKYNIKFPSYLFTSRVSHFAPAEDEMRFCRNKTILSSFVKLMKRAAVWQHIRNKEFIVINDENEKSSKRALKKELESLIK